MEDAEFVGGQPTDLNNKYTIQLQDNNATFAIHVADYKALTCYSELISRLAQYPWESSFQNKRCLPQTPFYYARLFDIKNVRDQIHSLDERTKSALRGQKKTEEDRRERRASEKSLTSSTGGRLPVRELSWPTH